MAPPRATQCSSSRAAEFQYTPPSYLLTRTKDTTNKPWRRKHHAANNEEFEFAYACDGEENEYDLRQEDRPQTRRESYLDAHFHQRVRTKQSRYRDIITGRTFSHGEDEDIDVDVDVDADIVTSERESSSSSSSLSWNSNNSHDNRMMSSTSRTGAITSSSYIDTENNQPISRRMNRKEQQCRTGILNRNPLQIQIHAVRTTPAMSSSVSTASTSMSSTASTESSSTAESKSCHRRRADVDVDVDAETIRSMRAHRLRSSLLKPTSDESDIHTKLEMRRLLKRCCKQQPEKQQQMVGTVCCTSSAPDRKGDGDGDVVGAGAGVDESGGRIFQLQAELEHKKLAASLQITEQKKTAVTYDATRRHQQQQEKASELLHRASELNQKRLRQRELDAIFEAEQIEEEQLIKRTQQRQQEKQQRKQQQSWKENSKTLPSTRNSQLQMKTIEPFATTNIDPADDILHNNGRNIWYNKRFEVW